MHAMHSQGFNSKSLKKKIRPSSSSKEISITKYKPGELKPIGNYTGNIYKVRNAPVLQDSKHISKVCPSKIPTDKETLYEENISLKQMYNFINEENLKLRTKIIQLEKTHEKKPENLSSPNPKSTHLLENLKQTIKDLKSEIQAKDQEIEDMRKYVRYTKMQEIESELRQYTHECMRLKRVIETLLVDKNIIPQGAGVYEKIRQDNEEMGKLVAFFKESEKIKTEQIRELEKKNAILEQKNKEAGSVQIELEDEVKRLLEKSADGVTQKDNLGDSEIDEVKSVSLCEANAAVQRFCEKIQNFLSATSISVKPWVTSISQSGIISIEALSSALAQDDINVTSEEIQEFFKEHGENSNQILSSTLEELFEGCEEETLTIEEAFEELKVRATNNRVKNLAKTLEKNLPDDWVHESDLLHLVTVGLFQLKNQKTIKLLLDHFFSAENPISKEKFIEKFEEGFKNWVRLKEAEISGIRRRFQGLLFECYEDLLCRLQEKTRFQSYISMKDLMQELRIHGILNIESEECCAKSIIYYYSKSVQKVPYFDIVTRFYENNIEDEIWERNNTADSSLDVFRRSMNSFLIPEEDAPEYNQSDFELNEDPSISQ